MDRKRLLTIFGIVFVDLVGFGLIIPLLPFYAQTFGANDIVVGLLVASYAAAQLLGGPLLGRLSDRYGRRPILLVSIFGTLLGFLLLGLAGALWMIFLSRIIDGLTGGNITVAQAYLSDISDEKNHSKAFGVIGAAFGLGFIIGPAAGGLLSAGGNYNLPAFIAVGLAAINLLLVFFLLPESLTPELRAAMAVRGARPAFTLGALWSALSKPRVGPLLHIRFFYGLAFAMFQSIFSQYASRLGLSVQTTGFVLTYVGVLAVFMQGFAVARLNKRFDDRMLIFASAGVLAISMLAWSLATNVWILLLVITPISISGAVLNTILGSSLTKAVYPEEIGGTLGLSTATESLTRVIAPSLGGLLLGTVGLWAPGIFTGLLMIWVFSFIWRRLFQRPDPPLPARGIPQPSVSNS